MSFLYFIKVGSLARVDASLLVYPERSPDSFLVYRLAQVSSLVPYRFSKQVLYMSGKCKKASNVHSDLGKSGAPYKCMLFLSFPLMPSQEPSYATARAVFLPFLLNGAVLLAEALQAL